MKQSRLVSITILFAFFLFGCGEEQFRAETTWHPDGRVERAIYQPSKFLPSNAQGQWEDMAPAPIIPSNSFLGAIREQAPASKGDVTYITAWGTFLSPEALPSNAEFPISDASKENRLKRNAGVKRLGFGTEYTWEETLTDVVSLADMETARHEVMELIAQLVEETLRDEAVKYDIAPLLYWIRSDGTQWFAELHASFVDAAVRGELREKSHEALAERFADVSAKHGLQLRSEDGSLIEGNESKIEYERFLISKVRELVETQEGTHIHAGEARQLLKSIGFELQHDTVTFEPSPAWKRAVETQIGDEEAVEAKVAEFAIRLLGVYQAGLFAPRRPFYYEMNVPGTIVETNGEIIRDNCVVWRFDAAEAFPFGYSMTVRSLAPNEAGQQAVFGEVRLASREELTKYTALVRADATLATVIAKCIQEGSLHPFEDHEKALADSKETEPADVARATAFRRLIDKHAQAK